MIKCLSPWCNRVRGCPPSGLCNRSQANLSPYLASFDVSMLRQSRLIIALDLIKRLNENVAMQTEAAENQTSSKLVEAGLHLFGHKGYEGTSTRELAARAGTNIGSIAYHFGGKAGLRAACARMVAARVTEVLDASASPQLPRSEDKALSQIEQMVAAFVRLIVGVPQAHDLVAFMLRELADPGAISDMIYAEFLEPNHRRFCALWAMATGRGAEEDDVKLAVFAVIGQVLYFRIASPFVQKRLGWDEIGESQTQEITATVLTNLRGIIERHRI